MKHTLKITLILVILFFITQIFGIFTISQNIEVTKDDITGEVNIEHKPTPIGEPPKTESGAQSVIIIVVAVLIGTLLLLLFIKLKVGRLWKYWYIAAVVMTMAVTFGVYIRFFSETLNYLIVLTLAIILAWYKIYKRNVLIHNITEVFIYTGIAVLFAGLFEGWLWAAFLVLIIISIYDMFAVWMSKHMIKIAEYQSKNKIFAGLSVPYKPSKGLKTKEKKKGIRTAVLGGGDLAFPLIFSGSVMSHLILTKGLEKTVAVALTSIISITATLALLLLFIAAKKDRFYPAMPFITAGCVVGYFVVLLFI